MKRIVAGLALVLAAAACSGASAPEAVVETFMLGLNEGRCEGIGDNLAASSRRLNGPKLEAVCRQNVFKGRPKPLASMKLIDRQDDGDRVTLNVQPQYADGSAGEPQRFLLVREDGAWKLDLLAMGRGRLMRGLPAGGAPPPAATSNATAQ